MAAVLTKKRKREDEQTHARLKKLSTLPAVNGKEKSPDPSPEPEVAVDSNGDSGGKKTLTAIAQASPDENVAIQIITGSYDRVLHGITASVPAQLLQTQDTSKKANGKLQSEADGADVSFPDTFLFAAHASSIRCLALSPSTQSNKRILATGSSDERINLYNISTTQSPKANPSNPLLQPLLSGTAAPTSTNPNNTSMGTVLHHDRPITHLHFPPNSNKLFSAAEDNTIAISRTRDWTLLSTIKAPVPKPQGRPSGDTAAPGEVPAGVNDFAIHPSQKLMLTVGRGEKCLRLWNLMTGKKAGVLNFPREVLAQVGEGKFSTGEGRRVLWNKTGQVYVVMFERGAVVFGIDSKPKAVIKPSPPTKLHQMRFLPKTAETGSEDVLAVSTDDGRVLFFASQLISDSEPDLQNLPSCPCLAELGGRTAGILSRIKDFEVLQLPSSPADAHSEGSETPLLVVTGSSDGAVRVWSLHASEICTVGSQNAGVNGHGETEDEGVGQKQIGNLIGTVETGNRITCLGAFVMDKRDDSNEDDERDAMAVGAVEDEAESESDFAGLDEE